MPPTELQLRPGLLARARARVAGWLQYLLTPQTDAVTVWAGTSTGPAQPRFPAARSMAALAGFAWVRACTRAHVDDVGGLPLVATRGRGQTEQLDDHPFLVLMRNPSPGVTETVFRRQLEADYALTGNAWIRLWSGPDGFELHRLHPAHVTAEVVRGRLVGWRLQGGPVIPAREVWHIRDISCSDDLSSVFGESPIRTLHEGLIGVRGARRHAAKQADRGRPDVIIGIKGGGSEKGPKDIGEGYEENAAKGKPAFVVNAPDIEVHPVTWSPNDLQFTELDTRVRDETLAVMRTPPTRAGIPQANYAVAKAELRDYWGSLVVSDLRLFEDAYTGIAHVVGGSLDVTIRHDVSAVEALQTSYDQRQARVGFWVTVCGATPADAAAYEGFRDAPVGDVPGGQAATRPAKEVDDQPNRQRAGAAERALTVWLTVAAERLQGGGADPAVETYRIAGVLELGGMPTNQALEVGREVAAIVCELANTTQQNLAEMYPFTAAYARTVANRPRLLAAK